MPQIVIADDSVSYRSALKSVLSTSGLKIVAEASNGLEALERVEECTPDLLLCDLNMPHLDGISVLERLKNSHPDLKVIIITMDNFSSEKALRSGANGYCIKNCEPKELLEGIRQVIEGNSFVLTD